MSGRCARANTRPRLRLNPIHAPALTPALTDGRLLRSPAVLSATPGGRRVLVAASVGGLSKGDRGKLVSVFCLRESFMC